MKSRTYEDHDGLAGLERHMLLMPAHEESRFEHFLFGSIIDAIIRRMPCSILLVKQKAGT